MKVKCPGCNKIYYETTEAYDPERRANGAMLELVEPYKSRGWGKYESGNFGGAEILAAEMLCVGCGAPLAPSGRIKVMEKVYSIIEPPTEPHKCPECPWTGKTEAAVKRHMTMNHDPR